MVLSHDCEIDKEFNELVDKFLTENSHATDAEACALFADRLDLDRNVLVSPLLPYTEEFAPPWKHDSIRQAQRIGYFPVLPIPGHEGEDYFVHFSRVSTIERQLLSRDRKVASLSEAARSLLRFKMAEALSSRNLSLVSKIEAAVGRTLIDVRTVKARSSSATVALILDDGSDLQVDAKRDPATAAPPERLRRT